MSINQMDSKWQVSDSFKPDKERLWHYPPENDGWVHAHNMIRQEVNSFILGLQNIHKEFPNATPTWAADSIKALWSHHYDLVMTHHGNEEDIIMPFIGSRAKLPDKMQSDHHILITKMEQIKVQVQTLQEGCSLESLITMVEEYRTIMTPHLQEEEEIALSLLRAYFTPRETRSELLKIHRRSSQIETGAFIHSMGEEFFRSIFMKQEKIPFFVWHLKFRNDLRCFLKNVQCHFDALEKGSPFSVPLPTRRTLFC